MLVVTIEGKRLSAQIFHIYPKPPYDFELNFSIFGFDKPMPEVFEDGVWRRAIRLDSGKLIPVALQSLGTIEEPKIEAKTFQTITEQEKEELEKKLDELFSFSQDLTALYSSWAKPQYGNTADTAIQDGIHYIKTVHNAAREADSELDNPDPMAFCKKCVELLDLPPDAANPLVARSLSSHRKTLSSGRLDPILDSLLKDADNV